MGKQTRKNITTTTIQTTATPQLDYQVFTYPNGIRVVHKEVSHTRIGHCGILMDIGSRDEKPEQQGLAHFWEHMAFKGTKKRKTFHILNRLDSLGGDLNAYTTKENICFHASVLSQHFEKAAELLVDITFHSVFPEKEIKKEKGVILEEMSMYEDDPQDSITDEFDELIFGDHPLGKNILGTRELVSGYEQADFFRFIQENLATDRLVFSSVGPYPLSKVLQVLDKYLLDLPAISSTRNRLPFYHYQPQIIEKEKDFSQACSMMGCTSFSLFETERVPFFLLTNLLGGPGMNSRLNLSIREKYGFVYDISASSSSLTDTGLFAIQFATDPKALQRCLVLVEKELKKLREQKLGSRQLDAAAQQLKGQMAMSEESNLSLMLVLGKNILLKNHSDSLATVFEKIDAITSSQLMEIANQVLAPEKLSRLVYLPQE